MKISYGWLREYINVDLEPTDVAKLLTDIGLEVAKNFLNSKTYDLTLHHHSNSRIFKNLKLRCNFIKSDLSNSNHSKILKKFDNNYDVIINLVGYISNQSFEKFNIFLKDYSDEADYPDINN